MGESLSDFKSSKEIGFDKCDNTEYSSESEPYTKENKIRKSGRMGKAPSRYIEDSESDSDFSSKQNKNVLIEKIEGLKSTKNDALPETCDDKVEYPLPYGWKKVCQKRK